MIITETIFSYKVGIETVIIPMADVQHIEVEEWGVEKIRSTYTVITKNTIKKNGVWQNAIKLKEFMGKSFIKAWTQYRHELDDVVSCIEKENQKLKDR